MAKAALRTAALSQALAQTLADDGCFLALADLR